MWSAVTPNPKDHEIHAAYERYVEEGCDVLIALGGGSCIDAAKGVAILSGNGGRILEYGGVDLVAKPIPPLLMIPSTSGTGADVSQFCIVTDTARSVKITIMGRALVPDISITDPRLLMTMPEWLNAATGLDALTHGIESFVSLAHNPLADIHALNAVGLVCQNLRTTILRPAEEAARSKMAQASLNAGLAFTNAILGATHAMSHQVGGLLDAPHGVVNGVLLPHVIRYNAQESPERFVDLARSAGLPVDGLPADVAAEMLAVHVRELADDVGVPQGLRELGVDETAVPRLALNTLDDACLTTNPRSASSADVEKLFLAAL
jgi:1,3-propanediol dehydrogenase